MKTYLFKATSQRIEVLFPYVLNILLTVHGRSLWESLDLGREYRIQNIAGTLTPTADMIKLK